jgi:hypothetical protein
VSSLKTNISVDANPLSAIEEVAPFIRKHQNRTKIKLRNLSSFFGFSGRVISCFSILCLQWLEKRMVQWLRLVDKSH